MIYITGDCHGDYRRFNTGNFPEQKEMTKEDFVIVCGDFGYWDASEKQKYDRKWLSEKSFTTLFVDGNHENYDMLANLPAKDWHGGKVQFVSDSIIHLMRGEYYDICGKNVFTFGGAASHDIDGGVFDVVSPEKCIKRGFAKMEDIVDEQIGDAEYAHISGRPYRINHVSWWKEELPSEEEMSHGRDTIRNHGYKADIIISHEMPSSLVALLGHGAYKTDKLSKYLEEIRVSTEYQNWFCGHYHDNVRFNRQDFLLYEQIVRIA